MATCTLLGSVVASSSNAITYSSVAATPATNDLLVALVGVTGATDSTWAMSDNQSGTWTKIRRQLGRVSADILEVWVRNQLAAASSTTFTYSKPASPNATGCYMHIVSVAGMVTTGASAIRSQGGQDNQTAATTPAPVLNQAALTTNPTLTMVVNATNPDAVTTPTNWTDRGLGGFTLPTTGHHAASRDSGFTGTTITWGSTSVTSFMSLAVELDAGKPSVPRARSPKTAVMLPSPGAVFA